MAATLTATNLQEGTIDGVGVKLYKKVLSFTDGNPVAGITNQSLGTFSGVLTGVRVLFGETAPNTLTVTLKDTEGHTVATGTLTASGSVELETQQTFVGGLTISLSGNTTASATATISILFV